MICRVCGGRFTDRELLAGYDEYPYGNGYVTECTHTVCPECGSQELVEECTCVQCGEDCSVQEVSGGFCRFCAQELEQTLDWIRLMLTPAQLRWMGELGTEKERLRAAELLGKRQGLFSDKAMPEGGTEVVIVDDLGG